MTARTAAVLVSGVLTLAAAACTNFYEIPIETPIKPKLDVTPQFPKGALWMTSSGHSTWICPVTLRD